MKEYVAPRPIIRRSDGYTLIGSHSPLLPISIDDIPTVKTQLEGATALVTNIPIPYINYIHEHAVEYIASDAVKPGRTFVLPGCRHDDPIGDRVTQYISKDLVRFHIAQSCWEQLEEKWQHSKISLENAIAHYTGRFPFLDPVYDARQYFELRSWWPEPPLQELEDLSEINKDIGCFVEQVVDATMWRPFISSVREYHQERFAILVDAQNVRRVDRITSYRPINTDWISHHQSGYTPLNSTHSRDSLVWAHWALEEGIRQTGFGKKARTTINTFPQVENARVPQPVLEEI